MNILNQWKRKWSWWREHKNYLSESLHEYFTLFNNALHETDILWLTSELSFYCALGIPIIMSPIIGSQEKFIGNGCGNSSSNEAGKTWLYRPVVIDLLNRGTLAESAWDGFLKARKLGTFKIKQVLEKGFLERKLTRY